MKQPKMDYKKTSRYVVLGILFFLPVAFLLFLYPATHNYTPLEIVNSNVPDPGQMEGIFNNKVVLKDHITILGFIGNNPKRHLVQLSNLKELVYDKFKGFKKFQIVVLAPKGTENILKRLKSEISSYEDLKFWHFITGKPEAISNLYKSLKSTNSLDNELGSDNVFIIDKELNQRGRLDDRNDNEIEKNIAVYGLYSYNCIEVAEIKNKMNDDLRILFTEYRQKRKGNFNSDIRRAEDLKEQIN